MITQVVFETYTENSYLRQRLIMAFHDWPCCFMIDHFFPQSWLPFFLGWPRSNPVAIPVKSRTLPRRARTGHTGLASSNPDRAPAGLAIWEGTMEYFMHPLVAEAVIQWSCTIVIAWALEVAHLSTVLWYFIFERTRCERSSDDNRAQPMLNI